MHKKKKEAIPDKDLRPNTQGGDPGPARSPPDEGDAKMGQPGCDRT